MTEYTEHLLREAPRKDTANRFRFVWLVAIPLVAVLSQVYIAERDFQGRNRQFELARKLADVDHEILGQAKNETNTDAQGKLAQIHAGLNSLYSDLRLEQDYGALQNAYGTVLASMGADPLPESVAGHDLTSLTQAVEAAQHGKM